MLKLVLLRHGQSIWNLENKFTGWMDMDHTDQKSGGAHPSGRLLKGEGYSLLDGDHCAKTDSGQKGSDLGSWEQSAGFDQTP